MISALGLITATFLVAISIAFTFFRSSFLERVMAHKISRAVKMPTSLSLCVTNSESAFFFTKSFEQSLRLEVALTEVKFCVIMSPTATLLILFIEERRLKEFVCFLSYICLKVCLLKEGDE